jgi:hypothetical protein
VITNECSQSTRSIHAGECESARVATVDSGAVGTAAFALFGGPLFGFETAVASRALLLFANDGRVTHRKKSKRSLMKGTRK